jgi:sulfite reductase (NADPH) flavoprotein alpha-component
MFSTGTGVAPFISFLQETEYRKNLQKDTNELILFFGSKNRDCDFIYEEEILSWKENGLLSGLYLAFSRDSVKVN